MTKEELKQEAVEYAEKINLQNVNISGVVRNHISQAYLAGAEPREKRIAELEKRCANYEMTISKMEKGTCDICKETEKDKRITELEMTVGTLRTFSNEQATCIEELEKACEETQELLDKQIEATYKLDKENAELKKDKKELCHSISEGGKACVYLNEQLTKGKVLLKQLVDAFPKSYSDVVKDTLDEARKFVEE